MARNVARGVAAVLIVFGLSIAIGYLMPPIREHETHGDVDLDLHTVEMFNSWARAWVVCVSPACAFLIVTHSLIVACRGPP